MAHFQTKCSLCEWEHSLLPFLSFHALLLLSAQSSLPLSWYRYTSLLHSSPIFFDQKKYTLHSPQQLLLGSKKEKRGEKNPES